MVLSSHCLTRALLPQSSLAMVSIIILALSATALVRFAVHQWRAIWIAAANQPISASLQTVTGIEPEAIRADNFGSLLSAYDQVNAAQKMNAPWLREITRYYSAISLLERTCKKLLPFLSQWAQSERTICSRYVAVILDQHLSMDLDRRAAVRS
jgi:hypothetical protein